MLAELKQKNELLERDVLRFQERQKHLKKVDIMEKKVPWLRFEESRKVAVDLQEKKKIAAQNLAQAESQLKPLQAKIKYVMCCGILCG